MAGSIETLLRYSTWKSEELTGVRAGRRCGSGGGGLPSAQWNSML